MAERRRGNPIGAVGIGVAENIRRVRDDRMVTQAQLSRALTKLGRPIPTASIGKIEQGIRAVEVEDLVAIAVALQVSPLALMLPLRWTPEARVDLFHSLMTAAEMWRWAVGDMPFEIEGDHDDADGEVASYRRISKPWWLEVHAEVPLEEVPALVRERLISQWRDGHLQNAREERDWLKTSIEQMEERARRGDRRMGDFDDKIRELRDRDESER